MVQPSRTPTATESSCKTLPGRLNENSRPNLSFVMRFARPSLDFVHVRGTLPILFAPVAHLDRASAYGSEGWVFDSRRVPFNCQSRSPGCFVVHKLRGS